MSLTRLVNRTLNWIGNDSLYLRAQVLRRNKRWLNLRHPKTFNDKLQWLKLYYRDPRLRPLVNKYECRNYVADKIGEPYLNPLLAVYDSPDEIDWDALPDRFAMKVAHGSHMNIICTDKSKLDVPEAVKQLHQWCSSESSSYRHLKEWAYGGGRRCIIVEEFLSNPDGESLNDYKFFCFNGEPKFIEVDIGRFTDHQQAFYDLQWNPQPFHRGCAPSSQSIPKPAQLLQMADVAHALADDLPFARIDLYAIDNRVIFGEITLYPGGALILFQPAKHNRIVGDMLILPKRSMVA